MTSQRPVAFPVWPSCSATRIGVAERLRHIAATPRYATSYRIPAAFFFVEEPWRSRRGRMPERHFCGSRELFLNRQAHESRLPGFLTRRTHHEEFSSVVA